MRRAGNGEGVVVSPDGDGLGPWVMVEDGGEEGVLGGERDACGDEEEGLQTARLEVSQCQCK
jgi:hypothetical protein